MAMVYQQFLAKRKRYQFNQRQHLTKKTQKPDLMAIKKQKLIKTSLKHSFNKLQTHTLVFSL